MKKTLIIFLNFLILLGLTLPLQASAEKKEKNEDIIVETFDTIKDINEIEKKVKKLDKVPELGVVTSTINGEEIPTYGLIEKVKSIKNVKTGDEEVTYRATIISGLTTKEKSNGDISILSSGYDEEWDPSISVKGYVRTEYTKTTKDDITYTKVSKWEAKYYRGDTSVSVLTPQVFAYGWGETLDGDDVQDCNMLGCQADEKYVSIDSADTWHSLYPYWSSDYLSETAAFGQFGGFRATLKRNTSTWDHEVSIRYGMYQR